jgi:predicted RNA binding protein YcfA (HicA-like mRNA interferase family)
LRKVEAVLARCPKLIEKARRSAANIRFEEALALAECLGFERVRTKASHHYFKRAGLEQTINLQPDKRDKSKAKKRQVEQLLKIYDDMGFPEER